MKFINFDNYIEKNDNEYINKNCFCTSTSIEYCYFRGNWMQ